MQNFKKKTKLAFLSIIFLSFFGLASYQFATGQAKSSQAVYPAPRHFQRRFRLMVGAKAKRLRLYASLFLKFCQKMVPGPVAGPHTSSLRGKSKKLSLPGVLFACCIFFISFIFTSPAYGAEYYVSPSGSDSNSGLIDAPFKTIQKGANVANPGDTVIVKDGNYTDTNNDGYVFTANYKHGTSNNWITFKAENKWGAVLDGVNYTKSVGIQVAFSSYIRIEDFKIQYMRELGVDSYSSEYVYFYRLYIHHIGQLACPASTLAEYNAMGGELTAHGYTKDGFMNSSNYTTFDSILMHDVGKLPCPFYNPNDYIHDHGYYAQGNNNKIINNVIYSMKAGYPIIITGGDGWQIINNTVFDSWNPELGGCISCRTKSANINNAKIENNICSGARYSCIDLAIWVNPSSFAINNNLTTTSITVQDIRSSATYAEANNLVSTNPIFVANHDVHLKVTSPAIDAGISFGGRIYDAGGNPIIGAPDIGAYEYIPTDNIPPSAPSGLTVQ